MEDKELYRIECYIASDENIVVSNLFKLVRIGNIKKRYGFICLTGEGGYGTETDDFGHESEAKAIVNMLRIGGFNTDNENGYDVLEYMSFQEACVKMINLKNELENKLGLI